ncbi:MAG: hypothetical protein P1V51_02210 [Deltaproteobacteria bacterium]|nr:hypothetical protein [Deltaproteobacteria bacterium]
MGLFSKEKKYSRAALLEKAAKARAKGKHKVAVEAYREILEHEPADPETIARLAASLAELKHPEAWPRFRAAADAFLAKGFDKKAMAVLRDALGHDPRNAESWMMLAELNLRASRKAEAIALLLEGRSSLSRRKDRPDAILILVRVLQLQAGNLDAALDLAWLLKKEGRRREALELLEKRTGMPEARDRRRVRAALFWLAPGFGALWRWIRATP